MTAETRASRFVHNGREHADDPRRIRVSFEFFPPKTEEMEKTLWDSITRLAPLKPNFVSVTYGAGGSTRERTHATVKRILGRNRAHARGPSHLRRRDLRRDRRRDPQLLHGGRAPHRGVARRSDQRLANAMRPIPAATATPPTSSPASSVIADVEVSVSAYPEKHPDSPTVEADLDMLAAKVDAGATRAITQFFFENDKYFRYLDRVRARGIDVPVVPGILPVQNFKQTKSFAARCGASVPDWLAERFDGLDDDAATRKLIAAAVAAEQVLDLVDRGVTDFHFYTMNRADLVYAVCHLLGLRPSHASGPVPCSGSSPRCGESAGSRVMNDKRDISPTAQTLRRLAAERILVLDGAMGTMIQGLELDEEGYRGARFDAWNREVRGNNDLLILSQPDAIRDIPSRVFPRRRRHRLDQHLLLHAHCPGRLRHAGYRP
jgi:methylenetetrahydrofolate reductase (NADPH)